VAGGRGDSEQLAEHQPVAPRGRRPGCGVPRRRGWCRAGGGCWRPSARAAAGEVLARLERQQRTAVTQQECERNGTGRASTRRPRLLDGSGRPLCFRRDDHVGHRAEHAAEPDADHDEEDPLSRRARAAGCNSSTGRSRGSWARLARRGRRTTCSSHRPVDVLSHCGQRQQLAHATQLEMTTRTSQRSSDASHQPGGPRVRAGDLEAGGEDEERQQHAADHPEDDEEVLADSAAEHVGREGSSSWAGSVPSGRLGDLHVGPVAWMLPPLTPSGRRRGRRPGARPTRWAGTAPAP